MLSRLKVTEKSWNDFWAAYWRIDHRHRLPGIFEWDRQLVDFIEAACKLHPGERILDLGCGAGIRPGSSLKEAAKWWGGISPLP